jgi:hypothetical protein
MRRETVFVCCDEADEWRVDDVVWESKDGHYRVRLYGEWVPVPDETVITEPNRFGPAVVWPYLDAEGQRWSAASCRVRADKFCGAVPQLNARRCGQRLTEADGRMCRQLGFWIGQRHSVRHTEMSPTHFQGFWRRRRAAGLRATGQCRPEPLIRAAIASMSRRCVLTGRQSLAALTAKTSPRPRLSHGGAFGWPKFYCRATAGSWRRLACLLGDSLPRP